MEDVSLPASGVRCTRGLTKVMLHTQDKKHYNSANHSYGNTLYNCIRTIAYNSRGSHTLKVTLIREEKSSRACCKLQVLLQPFHCGLESPLLSGFYFRVTQVPFDREPVRASLPKLTFVPRRKLSITQDLVSLCLRVEGECLVVSTSV